MECKAWVWGRVETPRFTQKGSLSSGPVSSKCCHKVSLQEHKSSISLKAVFRSVNCFSGFVFIARLSVQEAVL